MFRVALFTEREPFQVLDLLLELSHSDSLYFICAVFYMFKGQKCTLQSEILICGLGSQKGATCGPKHHFLNVQPLFFSCKPEEVRKMANFLESM